MRGDHSGVRVGESASEGTSQPERTPPADSAPIAQRGRGP